MRGGMVLVQGTDSKVSWPQALARVGGATIAAQELGLGEECRIVKPKLPSWVGCTPDLATGGRTEAPALPRGCQRGCTPLQIWIPARLRTPRLVPSFKRANEPPALSCSPPRLRLQVTWQCHVRRRITRVPCCTPT